MSSEYVSSFFPDASALLQRLGLWELLFPAAGQAACPAPTWTLRPRHGNAIALRWPLLIPLELLGLDLGLVGCALLLQRAQRLSSTQHHALAAQARLWARSFLFFGLMNAAAVACHNLLPAPGGDARHVSLRGGGGGGDLEERRKLLLYVVFRAVDVGCTGASCLGATAAATWALRGAGPPGTARRGGAAAGAAAEGEAWCGWADGAAVAVLVAALAGNLHEVGRRCVPSAAPLSCCWRSCVGGARTAPGLWGSVSRPGATRGGPLGSTRQWWSCRAACHRAH